MSPWLYTAAAGLAAAAGLSARYAWWRPSQTGLPVLMYHYLSDDLSQTRIPKLRVSPAVFERQMDWLAARGYRSVLPGELEAAEIPGRPVMITFDDGAVDCLAAAEIMERRGFRGVVFVAVDFVGRTNVWDRDKGEPEVRLMDWDELGRLSASGWEIGSHTRTHALLTSLADAELAEELAGSRAVLQERLGRPATSVAYPYGAADIRVRRAAAAAGYRLGFTTRPGLNRLDDDRLNLKRIIIKRRDNRLDLALKIKKGRSSL